MTYKYSPKSLGAISSKLCSNHPWVKGIHIHSNNGPIPFLRGGTYNCKVMNKSLLSQNHQADFNQIKQAESFPKRRDHTLYKKIIYLWFPSVGVIFITKIFFYFTATAAILHNVVYKTAADNRRNGRTGSQKGKLIREICYILSIVLNCINHVHKAF